MSEDKRLECKAGTVCMIHYDLWHKVCPLAPLFALVFSGSPDVAMLLLMIDVDRVDAALLCVQGTANDSKITRFMLKFVSTKRFLAR
jgi:hypothetical protein